MRTLKARDTISGQEGTAYATINGRNVELFYLKKLEAKVDKDKVEVKTLGRRGTQNKSTGFKMTGSMTIYTVTSDFAVALENYKNTGEDLYFNIKVTNEDKTSSIGRQTVILEGVNLDSTTLAVLDVEADVLEQDTDFTFEDFNIPSRFNLPKY